MVDGDESDESSILNLLDEYFPWYRKVLGHRINESSSRILWYLFGNRRNTIWQPMSVSFLPKVNEFKSMKITDDEDDASTPTELPRNCEWVTMDLSSSPISQFLLNEKFRSLLSHENDVNSVDDPTFDGPGAVESEKSLSRVIRFLNENFTCANGTRIVWHPSHIKCLLYYDRLGILYNFLERPLYLAIQLRGTTELIGFVSAIPFHMRLWNKVEPFYKICYLCVHEQFRNYKLAKTLIRELSRRLKQRGGGPKKCFFILGVQMPFNMLMHTHSYIYPIEVEKLNNRGIWDPCTLPLLPNKSNLKGVEKLSLENIYEAFELVTGYLNRFKISVCPTLNEFVQAYYMSKAVHSYVWYLGEKIEGFFSLILFSAVHSDTTLNIAHCSILFPTQNTQLARSMISTAKSLEASYVSAQDIMENMEFINGLNFFKGSDFACQYLHNWICDQINPSEWGITEIN